MEKNMSFLAPFVNWFDIFWKSTAGMRITSCAADICEGSDVQSEWFEHPVGWKHLLNSSDIVKSQW